MQGQLYMSREIFQACETAKKKKAKRNNQHILIVETLCTFKHLSFEGKVFLNDTDLNLHTSVSWDL